MAHPLIDFWCPRGHHPTAGLIRSLRSHTMNLTIFHLRCPQHRLLRRRLHQRQVTNMYPNHVASDRLCCWRLLKWAKETLRSPQDYQMTSSSALFSWNVVVVRDCIKHARTFHSSFYRSWWPISILQSRCTSFVADPRWLTAFAPEIHTSSRMVQGPTLAPTPAPTESACTTS